MLIFLVAVIMRNILYADSRVYCTDSNSYPWRPLGYSCPLNCYNIVHAIEKLRLIDYNNIMKRGSRYRESNMKLVRSVTQSTNETQTSVLRKRYEQNANHEYGYSLKDLYEEYLRILQNRKAITEIQAQHDRVMSTNAKCSSILKKYLIKPIWYDKVKKCRRQNTEEDYFLRMFTLTLNKYATIIKFTVDMTKTLLRKILGPNTDLRNGFMHVGRVVTFLRDAINRLEPTDSQITITLRSQHCVTMFVSGCFCKRGFVEKSGRCVRPYNCTNDEIQRKFLSRVFVK